MRPRRFVPVLLSCAAVSLAGCGGSSLLDGGSASELQQSLSSVRSAIDAGQCAQARSAAREGARRVEQLPSSVDAELKSTLKSGFQDLTSRVASDCEDTAATPTTTEAAPTTTTAPPADTTTTTDQQPDTGPADPGTTDVQPLDPPTTDQGGSTDPSGPGSGDDGSGSDDGGDDSGGVAPGVDGPGATGRAVPGGGKDAAKEFRKRLRDARKRAEQYLRGQGAG
jgi:hypothetical protein